MVLVEEVFHMRVEIRLTEFSEFSPDEPFVAVGPFQELYREIFSLLIFVVRDVVELQMTLIIFEDSYILNFTISINFDVISILVSLDVSLFDFIE